MAKKIILIISLLILISLLFSWCGLNHNEKYCLDGAWKLSEASYKITGSHLKLFTNCHFTTIWQDTSSNPSSIYPGFNGGIFSLEKNQYIEVHHFDHKKNNIGNVNIFKIEINKDEFIIHKLDQNDNDTGFFEKWNRIKLRSVKFKKVIIE